MGVKLLYSLKIFIDDDDDDVVERTRTGPSAVRSDQEHQVNHNAKISHFYHVFSSYEEGGPTGAGKTRCLAVHIPYMEHMGMTRHHKFGQMNYEFDIYIYICKYVAGPA